MRVNSGESLNNNVIICERGSATRQRNAITTHTQTQTRNYCAISLLHTKLGTGRY
jgi:hypothetical protein